MTGSAENDGYNALVLHGGLMWREVALIRAISRFLRQIRVPYSQDYMWATLVKQVADRGRHRAPVPGAVRSALQPHRRGTRGARGRGGGGDRKRARQGREPRRGPHPAPLRQCGAVGDPHQFLPDRGRRPREAADRGKVCEPASSTVRRCRVRSTKSSSIRRGSRPCTCASARWRAAASAGPTGRRTSAPRCSDWSRRSRSRTP